MALQGGRFVFAGCGGDRQVGGLAEKFYLDSIFDLDDLSRAKRAEINYENSKKLLWRMLVFV